MGAFLATFMTILLPSLSSHAFARPFIPICLTGLRRSFDSEPSVQSSILQHVLAPLRRQGLDPHVFLYTDAMSSTPPKIPITRERANGNWTVPDESKCKGMAKSNMVISGTKHTFASQALTVHEKRMGCLRMVEEHCESVRGESDLGKCAEFLVHGRPDMWWFAPIHPDLLALSRDFVWTHANHFPVGDMLFVIPGKLAQTFYHGIDQLMFPNCCECKPKMCRYQSEPTFMRFFAGMRLLQIDVLPFPFALFRPTGGKWPTGAECFRWGPPYYQEARYFNDSFPREACSRAARKLSWIDAVNPRYMKINKTVEYENLASVGACEGTGNPYLQGEKHPVEGHKMVYSDFRNYTSSWLNY